MEDIRFIPLGVSSKNKYSVNADFAQTSSNIPTASLLSGVGLNLTGSIGDMYLTVSASTGPLPDLGLVVG